MNNDKPSWLQKPIHPSLPAVTNEIVLFAGIMLLAILTRFYDLGTRVMSHDESLHTYFSWLLYRGQGYQHTPMMHGPFQFHFLALIYFLFGVSDFTARIATALFSIAIIWMVWYWRRYLGNWGMIVAGLLMVISPYMLYYGRYVRNESFVGFSGILMLYAILRYIESGEKKYIYMVTAAIVLHFCAKETSFIYAAQALIFLGIYFIAQVTRKPWENNASFYKAFIVLLVIGVVLFGIGGVAHIITQGTAETLTTTETAAPANPSETPAAGADAAGGLSLSIVFFALGGLVIAVAGGIYFYLAYVRHEIIKNRAFDLLIALFTFCLPLLSAFVLDLMNKLNISQVTIPTESSAVAALDPASMLTMGIVVAVLFILSIMIGLLWNREWWKYGALYWGVFTILYTTVFTNASGFFSGVVGSLGYWLAQQGVERGSQPEYYYVLVQIPIYEFLPAIGAFVAIGLGLKKLLTPNQTIPESEAEEIPSEEVSTQLDKRSMFVAFFSLMVFWCFTSIAAFSIAGERMPWLTLHMAWPMVLFTGWAIGQIIESIPSYVADEKPVQVGLTILVMTVFVVAAFHVFRSIFGANPPFQGTDLGQLEATGKFIFPLVFIILSGVLLAFLMRKDYASLGMVGLLFLAIITLETTVINGASMLMLSGSPEVTQATVTLSQVKFATAVLALIGSIVGIVLLARYQRASAFFQFVTLTIFGLLAVQTARTAFRANYINYNDATEYLVYAHGAGGVKEVMAQVEEISRRTAGGLNAIVGYDASAPDTGVSWPLVWYLRDYTALRSFDQPTRSLREAVTVIVDQKNFDKIEPALGDGFYRFDYIRMWWPNQDYFNLDKSRVLKAITDPGIREGIFDIWLDRDYTKYAQATGSTSMTLTTWQPADQMRLYIRKDVASQIWNYGVGPSTTTVQADPYEAGTVIIPADQIFGADRYPPLGLNAPRAIAAGNNNDFYLADSRNNRILHISSDGTLLHEWGTLAAIDYFNGPVSAAEAIKQAPIGTFSEPWGVAVGPDGSVYVTDTWNHRVQKFSADGKPIKIWGQYGQPTADIPESKSSLWGPRGIAVDSMGHILVADTGNKRIVIFDSDGNYLSEFGSGGFDPGQFDEPVGLAVGPDGIVYVTDTWNQRIQSFLPDQSGTFYSPYKQWDVNAWFGQSLDNKPFIAVGSNNHVYITDPEGYRIIEFTANGEFVRTWGDFGTGDSEIGLAAGVTVDPFGFVWVTDAGNNRILRYRLP